jgi:crotonobetainyl-CoA:carnitine CoA-transferase CaiB-like acyl-CoA transferase
LTNGPLQGTKVVEIASFVTGPFAAMMLADMGAEVIKVEPPTGEPFRRFGRRVAGMSVNFLNANRNKKDVAIDLAEARGAAELTTLLEHADVLVTNWRPGVAERLGLAVEEVRRRFPRLVWVRISGFGPDGPLAATPAFDGLIQARSGLAVAQGDDAPHAVWAWLADKSTAAFAVQAVLAALVQRGVTGEGAVIELPMLDAFAYFNFPDLLTERTILGEADRPALNPQMRSVRPVPTRDGWVLLAPVRGAQLKRALVAFGHADRVDELKGLDPATASHRFFEIAAASTPSKTTTEWLEIFATLDVPAAPVLDFDAHLTDPQILHNQTYVEVTDSRFGTIRQPRFPARFSTGDAGIAPAPELDQDRAEVFGPTS